MFSKKITLIGVAVVQLALIFFYIYTQSSIIKLTYANQDTERTLQALLKREKELTRELLDEQNPEKLQQQAASLSMKKARISDIKNIPTPEPESA
jgi:cell division protein FtsL